MRVDEFDTSTEHLCWALPGGDCAVQGEHVQTQLAYGASEADRHYIVTGQERIRVPHAVEGVAVGTDGSRTTTWYRDGDPAGQRLVINGVAAGRYYTRVSRPLIHADTGAYIYTAQDNFRFHVVTARGQSDAYDGVLWNPRLREDGAVAGYVALNGNRLLWKVASLR